MGINNTTNQNRNNSGNLVATPVNKMVDQVSFLDLGNGDVLKGNQFYEDETVDSIDGIDKDHTIEDDSEVLSNSNTIKLREGVCMHGAVTIMYKRLGGQKRFLENDIELAESNSSIEVNEFEIPIEGETDDDKSERIRKRREAVDDDKSLSARLNKIFKK